MEEITALLPSRMVGHRIRRISNGIDKLCCRRKEEAEDTLTAAQGPMMGYLIDHRKEDIFQKDLEKAFSITGATASNMLKGLEKKGMIRRIQMPQDGRLKKLVPTDRAIARENRIRSEILKMEEGMTEGFTEEEREQFLTYMDRVIANLDRMNSRRQGSGEKKENQ